MKKLKIWSLLLALTATLSVTSCSSDKDEEELDLSTTEIITMAPHIFTRPGWENELYPTFYLIKKERADKWQTFYSTIEGFTFEDGYETVMEVRIDPIEHPMADQGNEQYTLIKIISRTQKESEDLPEGIIIYRE